MIKYLDKGNYGEHFDIPLPRNYAPEGKHDFKLYFKCVRANEKEKVMGEDQLNINS